MTTRNITREILPSSWEAPQQPPILWVTDETPEALAPARGLLVGALGGVLLWAPILVCVWRWVTP